MQTNIAVSPAVIRGQCSQLNKRTLLQDRKKSLMEEVNTVPPLNTCTVFLHRDILVLLVVCDGCTVLTRGT